MLSVLGIYLAGLALCLLTGVVVGGLLRPRGRWVGVETLPLGLCALIALLYPLGAALPGDRASPIALGIVVAGGGVALWRVRRDQAEGSLSGALRRALRPTRAEGVVLGGGTLVGALILIPTMAQGFATTIATTNYDGWAYATLVDWLTDHPFPREVANLGAADPLTLVPSTTMDRSFSFGFEHFAALLATLLGRDGFEVVNAAAAVCLAAGVGGWAMLALGLRSRLEPSEAALVALAAATPLAALPFAENFTTQFVSICLWPFAVGAFVRFAREPAWRELLVAGLATAGVVGVYPAMGPWLALPVVAIAILAPPQPRWEAGGLRRVSGPSIAARAGRAALLVAVLCVAVAVLAPIQVSRVFGNLRVLDSTPITGVFIDFFSAADYASFFLGAASASSIVPAAPLAWSVLAALILLAVVNALACAPWRRPERSELVRIAVTGGALLTTGAAVLRYHWIEEHPYQVYKALILGGGVLAGLAVIGLLPSGGPRARGARVLALGCMVAIWIPVTSQTLQASDEGATGFRAADVEMGHAIDALPPGSTILAEGAAHDERASQFRMMAAYFTGRAPGLKAVGLGSTTSFLSSGGLPEWRPAMPWTHVLTTRPQPVASPRTPVWTNGVYTLEAAPALDVTTYGLAWYPPEDDGRAVFAWTSGAAELVVANRDAAARRARLHMEVGSYGRARTLVLSAGGRTVERRVAAAGVTPVSMDLELPPASATTVTLDARPGAAPAPPPDPRMLMLRVQGLRVTPR